MAVTAVVKSDPKFVYLFLLLTVVTANTTESDFNTTVFDAYNFSYNVTESTQPPVSESTTTAPSNSTEMPNLAAVPLPVSGHLPSPLTSADRLCPCDEHMDVCDINCCCDRVCNGEVPLFTSCSYPTVSGSKQMCNHDVAFYSLSRAADGYSELLSSAQKETNYDIFCIESQNRVDGLSYPSPALPTDSNFASLFKQFTSFIFGLEKVNQVSSVNLQTSRGYQYGDVIVTAGAAAQRGILRLPTPGVTADCVDNSPAAFLKDQSSRCSRHVVLDQDCGHLPALSMDGYTDTQLFSDMSTDAAVVPVVASSVILQSADHTQTELKITGRGNISPVLINPTLCGNVVLKVLYVIKYNPHGKIDNATVSVVLGFVTEAMLPLEQEFQVMYIQAGGGDVNVHYSGNPGYVVGLPLVSGTRTADGIVRSIDLRDTLSLLHSTEDQDCLQGPHQRSPVLFGQDSLSGCLLRLEDGLNCTLVSQELLRILRGFNYPYYVASFGNSPLDNILDWVQIKTNFNPTEAPSCSIPLSLHLEIEWTKYGSLVNPQAEIVSIKEVIQSNTSSLTLLSRGSGILPIRSSVAFIPVSAAALPGYRATPTINAKLPFDFFFPFV
ncbi:tectonic-1 isoform X1 [Oreochromis niloticus]|uniref:Uncharacterized protein n=2 Tax=Oreochromis niloticus TaxID=8128 RepID=I3K0G0_ORENI|nr:tectonic-1 isoform X1 [Oreochromis niloticus]CAI5682202.1 unnamed protein product [Mustela putorius furo]